MNLILFETDKRCDRCGCSLKGEAWSMSYFNTDILCLACVERERAHPHFETARRIEEQAVRLGNYNYQGIGKPSDL